jgi:hypothetical protein
MLDEEPYASDVTKKLTQNLRLSLRECALDPSASLDVIITFDNSQKQAAATGLPQSSSSVVGSTASASNSAQLRDTMIKNLLGKFVSASQSAK